MATPKLRDQSSALQPSRARPPDLTSILPDGDVDYVPLAGPLTASPTELRYEDDYHGWAHRQAALLRAGRFAEVDFENVAEELDGMARSEVYRLGGALKVLVMHMLKWDHQPEHRSFSWLGTIREQRRRVDKYLKDSPSLKPKRADALAGGYEDARIWAANEMHVVEDDLPPECPYTWEDVTTRPFDLDPPDAKRR